MPIEVFVRVRDGKINRVSRSRGGTRIEYEKGKQKFTYTVDEVWDDGQDNDSVYKTLIESHIRTTRQFWVTFGYTGSGKTYTTTGLLERLLEEVSMQGGRHTISAYQIDRFGVRDLLNGNVSLRHFKTERLVIQGLSKVPVDNIANILNTISTNRDSASTVMNSQSSRTHAIFDICSGTHVYTLVDMAGQESGSTNSDNGKAIQMQGRDINLDMLALKECIRALHSNSKHVPFRQSLLSLALKPMFYKRCYVAFICNMSVTHPVHFQMDSLTYASALRKPEISASAAEADEDYYGFFKEFTSFVEKNGWISCEERMLWRQMKAGNLVHCGVIESFMKQRRRELDRFEKVYAAAKSKLPRILNKGSGNESRVKGVAQALKGRRRWQNAPLKADERLPPIPKRGMDP